MFMNKKEKSHCFSLFPSIFPVIFPQSFSLVHRFIRYICSNIVSRFSQCGSSCHFISVSYFLFFYSISCVSIAIYTFNCWWVSYLYWKIVTTIHNKILKRVSTYAWNAFHICSSKLSMLLKYFYNQNKKKNLHE